MHGSYKRVKALILQEIYMTRHSLEIFFDIIVFPMMNVILFGLITSFFGEIKEATSAQYLMIGILLWQLVQINQYNITVSTMWSVWSHNLTNIFTAPISAIEYIGSHILASAGKALLIFGILSFGAFLAFDFNILNLGIINLILFFINLSIFAWWLGIIFLGLIFRFGTRIQSIAWGAIFFFQPVTAVFYPVSVLPDILQKIAFALPPTYVFEDARQALTHSGVDVKSALYALFLNLVYAALGLYIFTKLFRKSKTTGQFARNDL